MQAAARLGYERNHLAQSLRSGRSGMLGLVIPDIANPFWAEVARGAQDEAAQAGQSLLIFSSDWDAGREASHLQALRQARVDGALVNPVSDYIDGLGRFGLPVVLIGSSAERFPELSSVGSDIKQGVELGLQHLAKIGHRPPALIMGPKNRLARVRFFRAVHDWCIEHGVDPEALATREGEYSVQSGIDATKSLLSESKALPSCIFAANDLMALGAVIAVQEVGLRCPEDISVLGFDGIPAGAYAFPGLTTISKPSRQIGIEGVRLLKDEIEGRLERRHVLLPCAVTERASLAEARAGAKIAIVERG